MEVTKCKKENKGKNITNCQNCGDPKENGESLQHLPGDWKCIKCKTSNFARRVKCYNCNERKTERM